MKQTKMSTIPKCDLCGDDASYDAPSKQGPWGYFCINCYEEHAIIGQGTELVLKPPQKPATGKFVKGRILTSMEDMMMDSVIEVECTNCGEVRNMEPDSSSYQCECGCKVRYNPFF